MKNATIIIAIFLFCMNSYSQKMSENLKFHAVDIGFGFFLNKNFGGISAHSGIALKNKKIRPTHIKTLRIKKTDFYIF
jgi:hypothetical protein